MEDVDVRRRIPGSMAWTCMEWIEITVEFFLFIPLDATVPLPIPILLIVSTNSVPPPSTDKNSTS